MIRKKTVFVLGAGASEPYGLPLGGGLWRSNARAYFQDLDRGTVPALCRRSGIPDGLIRGFGPAIEASGRDSIDAFVQSRREFLDLAKIALAISIGPREIEGNLTPAANDWMGYLFNRMLGESPADFKKNRLRVITFNFDRSFERRLWATLKANYNLAGEAAATLAREALPVLHFHGQLGTPLWMDPEAPAARDYTPLPIGDSDDEIRMCANSIKIIHEEIPSAVVNEAREWLHDAEVICFIGFGYHPLNVERLGLAELARSKQKAPIFSTTGQVMGQRLAGLTVAGTTLGLEAGERYGATRVFDEVFETHGCGALDFLRRTTFIHD